MRRRGSKRTRRRLPLTLLACAAVALAAAGIATAAARHARPHARHHTHARLAADEGAPPYAALSRTPTQADRENGAVVGAAEQDGSLQPAEARVLEIGSSGRTWLIPTSDGELCLGVQPAGQYDSLESERGLAHLDLGLMCAPIAAAGSQGIILRIYDEVVGIVPDGVGSVTSTTGADAPVDETVSGNTYRFAVPDGFQEGTVSFETPDGVEQVNRF